MPLLQIKTRSAHARNAFTLVEMLVVIAIISILMTVGSVGISGLSGKGVTSGVATAEALFDEARSTAVARNLRSAVLVAKTLDNKRDEDLRRIVVAYEETNPDGTPKNPPPAKPKWVLSSRGTVLPEQTFFSKEFSSKDHQSGGTPLDEITQSDIVSAKGAFKGRWFIYEFNSQGIIKTPGASFIIGSGVRNLNQPSTSSAPRVTGSAKRDFGGFVIWRNGRTSLFRSPDHMSIPATVTDF